MLPLPAVGCGYATDRSRKTPQRLRRPIRPWWELRDQKRASITARRHQSEVNTLALTPSRRAHRRLPKAPQWREFSRPALALRRGILNRSALSNEPAAGFRRQIGGGGGASRSGLWTCWQSGRITPNQMTLRSSVGICSRSSLLQISASSHRGRSQRQRGSRRPHPPFRLRSARLLASR